MTKKAFTFYDYIINYQTENTTLFINNFSEILEEIPNDKVYSSKYLHSIIKDNISNSFFKQRLFQNTFSEYFKYKVMNNF